MHVIWIWGPCFSGSLGPQGKPQPWLGNCTLPDGALSSPSRWHCPGPGLVASWGPFVSLLQDTRYVVRNIYTYTHTYIYIYRHVYIYTCIILQIVHIPTYVYVYIYVYIDMCLPSLQTGVRVQGCGVGVSGLWGS